MKSKAKNIKNSADFGIIILAGGKSSRMGQDKGLIKINGKHLVEYIIETVKAVSENLMISTNNNEYVKFGIPIIEDIQNNIGPIGGIYASLLNSKHNLNMIISCDMPYITPEFVAFLVSNINDKPFNIVKHEDFIEPLCSFYRKDALDLIKDKIDKGDFKILNLFEEINTHYIEAKHFGEKYDIRLFQNLNTPELVSIFKTFISYKRF